MQFSVHHGCRFWVISSRWDSNCFGKQPYCDCLRLLFNTPAVQHHSVRCSFWNSSNTGFIVFMNFSLKCDFCTPANCVSPQWGDVWRSGICHHVEWEYLLLWGVCWKKLIHLFLINMPSEQGSLFLLMFYFGCFTSNDPKAFPLHDHFRVKWGSPCFQLCLD